MTGKKENQALTFNASKEEGEKLVTDIKVSHSD